MSSSAIEVDAAPAAENNLYEEWNIIATGSENNFGFDEGYFYTTIDYANANTFMNGSTWYRFQSLTQTNRYDVGDTLSVWTLSNLDNGANHENVAFQFGGAMQITASVGLALSAVALF